MENQKQKKSVGTVLLVILLLIVTIASLILATYAWAKYTSQETGSATAQVAKWNVDVKFANNDFTETASHVLAKRLAPGMSGSFDITINPNSTEVDFDYDIILENVSANAPKHLHFYTQSSHDTTCEIELGCPPEDQQNIAQNYLHGTIEASKDPKNSITKTIYWEWPYEAPDDADDKDTDTKEISGNTLVEKSGGNGIPDYDDQDTLDGQKAENVEVTFKVTATQVDPNT